MIVSFLNSLLKIEFPKRDLTIRNVKLLGEGINSKTRSANTSISESIGGQNSEKPQKLEVDALFSGEVEAYWDPVEVKKFQNVRVLVEMQVSEQEFGIRLINYVQNISSQQKINVSKKKVPDPVIGFGLCMWNEENFTAGDSFNPSKLHSKKLECRTETRARNIFLNQILPYGVEKKTRVQVREDLRKNVVEYFNKELDKKLSNTKLSEKQKEVYEWLEFISCGHLMTPKDVKKIKNKYIQEAYKMSELEFVSRDRLQGEIPQLYTEFKSAQQLQEVDSALKTTIKLLANSFIVVTDRTLLDFKKLDKKSQEYLIKELCERRVDVAQYEKEMLQPTTRPNTTEETGKKKSKKMK